MIAIRDFKMPLSCEECFARIMAWCRLDEEERMVVPALPDELPEGRPDWCPLVDVPDTNVGKCSEFPNNSDCVSKRVAVEAIANQSRFSAEEIINICDKSVQDENGWLGGLKEAILAVLELPSAQPEQRYTEEELRVFQHGISLSLLSKRSSQYWKYDEDTATEIKFLERLYEKVGADMRTKKADYERAVEQLEHDMLYEPTFNQDDGSM